MNKFVYPPEKYLSIIIPVNNEEDNIILLYTQLKEVLNTINKTYEIIFIDDGSNDKTYQYLCEIHKKDKNLNIIKLIKKYGQTASLSAGFYFSKGEIVITMDGDLQHNPYDIPKFLEKIEYGYDLVNGWKNHREDNFLNKILPSLIANKIINILFNTELHEICCSFRAYRQELIKDIKLYGESHRFIPLLMRGKKISITEVKISCNKRRHGKSHYGLLGRMKRVILDISYLYRNNYEKIKDFFNPKDLIKELKFHP
ncbi:MAG: glycosyltransferase family 2 protein [Candidatus Omnitrophota bacterium]